MKNLLKIFVLLFVAGVMSSCEPDEYDVPDIDLTPVYQIFDIMEMDTKTGEFTVPYKTMARLDVYKEISVLYVWNKDGIVVAYNTQNFSDTSDDVNYNVAVTAIEDKVITDDLGSESTVKITHDYTITGDKTSGAVSIEIVTTDENAAVSTKILTGTLSEEEVYN